MTTPAISSPKRQPSGLILNCISSPRCREEAWTETRASLRAGCGSTISWNASEVCSVEVVTSVSICFSFPFLEARSFGQGFQVEQLLAHHDEISCGQDETH